MTPDEYIKKYKDSPLQWLKYIQESNHKPDIVYIDHLNKIKDWDYTLEIKYSDKDCSLYKLKDLIEKEYNGKVIWNEVGTYEYNLDKEI